LIAAAASLMRGGRYHYTAPVTNGALATPGPAAGIEAGTITAVPTREEQHAS
jgi:hypothetical protein